MVRGNRMPFIALAVFSCFVTIEGNARGNVTANNSSVVVQGNENTVVIIKPEETGAQVSVDVEPLTRNDERIIIELIVYNTGDKRAFVDAIEFSGSKSFFSPGFSPFIETIEYDVGMAVSPSGVLDLSTKESSMMEYESRSMGKLERLRNTEIAETKYSYSFKVISRFDIDPDSRVRVYFVFRIESTKIANTSSEGLLLSSVTLKETGTESSLAVISRGKRIHQSEFAGEQFTDFILEAAGRRATSGAQIEIRIGR